MKYFLVPLLFIFNSYALDPFETDGCTFIIDRPIFSKKKSFKPCCYLHDISYWIGGSKKQRKTSDKELKKCIKKESNGFYGSLFYLGVRTGHLSPIKSRFQWGWGRKDKDFSTPSGATLSKAKLYFNSNEVNEYLDHLYSIDEVK